MRLCGGGEQRVGQPSVLQGAAGEDLDAASDPPDGVARPLEHLAQYVDLAPGGAPEHLDGEGGLGREVLVDGTGRDARRVGDGGDGRL